ncbi:MAG: hypothetical protein V4443_09975 [Pseudomonadota bacterium]
MRLRFGFIKARLATVMFTATLVLGGIFASHQVNAADAVTNFEVRVATKDQSHPQYNKGSQVGFVVNGVQGQPLILVRGKTYTFNVDTPAMHDFYITEDPVGAGPGALTQGVTGNFTYKGVVTFKPTAETPDLVYYNCRNHKNMGGEIHVVNAGEESKIKLAVPAPAASGKNDHPTTLDKGELKQKVSFAEMSISTSEAAKRIAASSNSEAKEKYKGAQDKLASAKTALNADNLADAQSNVEIAIALMKEASALVPSEFTQKRAKAKFEEQLQGVTTLEKSYKQNLETIGGGSGAKLDLDKIHKTVESAKALGAQGQYDKANSMLSGAMGEISGSLNTLLGSRTMAYELKFTSPQQEYEYELERYNSLDKLIPQTMEQKPIPDGPKAEINNYLVKAKERYEQAVGDGKNKEYKIGVDNLKYATEQLEAALKILSGLAQN